MLTELLTPQDLSKAARLLQNGHCVAFATETVYGLGADATNGQAVAAIYDAKGRPSFNPLIVHVPDIATAQKFCLWSETAQTLADAFWPGPLTLVLPLSPASDLSDLVTAGLPSVAIRVPAHQTARALLRETGRPIAAPSANRSGQISPTQASHVFQDLGGRIAAILDDGPCSVGLESTIIGLTDTPRLLRPGGVATEDIEAIIGTKLAAASAGISAPGQLSSHYAPNQTVRLNATHKHTHEFLIGFGDIKGDLSLSDTADLHEACANLFETLHIANASGLKIAVAPVPETGLGLAINDRLQRAAAPRP